MPASWLLHAVQRRPDTVITHPKEGYHLNWPAQTSYTHIQPLALLCCMGRSLACLPLIFAVQ